MENEVLKTKTVPNYILHPTPHLDRDELHRHVSPLLTNSLLEINRYDNYMSDIADSICSDSSFDRKCVQMCKSRQLMSNGNNKNRNEKVDKKIKDKEIYKASEKDIYRAKEENKSEIEIDEKIKKQLKFMRF